MGDSARGGGINGVNLSGNVTLTDSVISDNSTTGRLSDGGGIAGRYVTVTDSIISDNSTTGVYADGGGIASERRLIITGSTIRNNRTEGFRSEGGGIAATESLSGDLTLTNSTVSDNSTMGDASRGGGIFVRSGATISDSRVFRNSTMGSNSSGGGIFASGVELINSSVSDNSTSGNDADGGGIFGDVASLLNTTVSGNSTTGDDATGGGIHVDDAFLTLTNSTVSGNSTAGNSADGGGIYAFHGPVTLTNSTVTDNSAEEAAGGGVYFTNSFGTTSLSVLASIVAGNMDDGTAPNLRRSGSILIVVDHSLIGDTTGSLITDLTGFGNLLNVDPQLLPLAFNGGATKTHALLPESPAIDASPPPVPLQEYELNGSFVDSQGNAPDLAHFGGILDNNGRYVFDANQGLETQIPAENSSNYSIELKFRPDSLPLGDQKLLDFNRGESAEGLYVNGRRLVYRTGDSSTSFFNTPFLFPSGSFRPPTNITLTRSDSSPLTVYVDGELFHTFPLEAPSGNTIGVFENGANPSDALSARFFIDDRAGQDSGPGYVDFIRIYDRALTAEEVSDRLLFTNHARLDQRLLPRPIGSAFDIGAFEFNPNDQSQPPTVTATVRDMGGVLARPDLLSTFSVSFDVNVNVSVDDLEIRNDTLGGEVDRFFCFDVGV